MPTSFLILSDIHFGHHASSVDFAPPGAVLGHQIQNAVPMRDALIATAQSLSPDVILVPGDITSIASPAEFTGGIRFVSDVADVCGVPWSDTFYTFGNHDANWRISKLGEASGTFPSDEGYERIAGELGGLCISNPDCEERGPIAGCGLFKREAFDVLVLNTGYFCSHSQVFPHGKLGIEQLNWAKETLAEWQGATWKVVMLHHHLFNYPYPTPGPEVSMLEEGAELLELLGKAGVDIVCHGHRHHPKMYTRVENGWDRPITFFCAGSVAVTEEQRNNGQIPNLFHVVSLHSRDASGAAVGKIDSFKYTAGEGWIRSSRSAETPLDSPQMFGSCATAAQCRADAEGCIHGALANLPSALPEFTALPISLQCMSWVDLKALFIDVAAASNCEVYGDYPSHVLLMQK